jgi:hypothetical protein
MKYLILFSTLLCTAPSMLHAQKKSKKQADETPAVVSITEAIRFNELLYDFGKIPQGKPVHHTFTVDNITADTLRIDNVQTSCGCTTPEYSKELVRKGGKVDIKVGYNAASEGQFEKSITVTYNGGQVKQLLIRGIVWKTPDYSVPSNQGLKIFSN